MATMYYEKDCNPQVLEGKKIAIIGYGSQGHAHALNLRDSGYEVRVGLYEGSKSAETAKADGFEVMLTTDAVEWADVIMIVINDEKQADMYKKDIDGHLRAGQYLGFAHGFNITYKQIIPPADVNVFMVAPKGPGHTVRSQFVDGKGVPCLVAAYQDPSGNTLELAKAYAAGLGGARGGILLTTMKDETETDLFGEQCVLMGGLVNLMKSGFDTLVEAGYYPENAYFECIHEMKLITDLIFNAGFEGMNYSCSDTAEYGEYVVGPTIITDESREGMKKALKNIQDGTFARDWLLESKCGRPHFLAMRDQLNNSFCSETGRKMRDAMGWKKVENLDEAR